MPSLKGRSPTSAYQELLKISNQGAGLDGTLRNIEDGAGNPTGIQIGTGMVAIFGYKFPASGFTSGQVLRINSANNAFEWHSMAATDVSGLSAIATSGHYSDLTGTPTIPTSLSQLTNDSGFATTAAMQSLYGTGAYVLPTASASTLGGIKLGTGLTSTAGVVSANVTTVAGRTGAVTLSTTDITGMSSYAPLASPVLSGTPTTPTALAGTNNTQIASTAFVAAAIPAKVSQLANDSGYVTASTSPVLSVAGRTGTITLAVADVSGAAPLSNAALTGSPTTPTATAGTNTTQIASTAFVTAAVSTVSSSIPTKTSQLTNDAGFLTSVPVTSVAGRTGAITLSTTDISGIGSYATLASPTFTGTPAVPTAIAGTNTTQVASTAFVTSAITTATPTKVSQLTNDSGYVIPANEKIQSVAGRTGTIVLSTTDISGISSYATLASPTFTGTPIVPTATAGTNTTQAASTAFVTAADAVVTAKIPTKVSQLTNDSSFITASGAPVQTVAGRTGTVTLAVADVSGAAPLASPVFTGTPTAPTPTWGDNSTNIATTAFVQSAGMQFNGFTLFNTPTTLTNAQIGMAIQNYAAGANTFTLPASSTIPAGKTFYIFNQGGSTLTIVLAGTSDFLWSGIGSLTTLVLNRGESVMIMSRASTEYDIIGGTYANKFAVRQLVNTTTDDGASALQVNGIATVTSPSTGDNTTKVATTAWVNSTPFRRNKIVNSRFDIWQRGTSWTTPATGTYTADRWRVDYAGTSAGVFTVGQALANTQPNGITSSVGPNGLLSWNHTTAPNLTSLMLSHRCEDAQTYSGQTCTVSFNIALGAGVQTAFTLGVNLAQCYGTGGSPSATVTTATQNFTINSATFTRLSATFTLPTVSGTFGTNGNDYVAVQFILPTNQTFSFYIDHIQFESGAVATPFMNMLIPQELAECQRYYQKTFPTATTPAINTLIYVSPLLAYTSLSTASVYACWDFDVPMRATPTVTLYTVGNNATAYWTSMAGAVVTTAPLASKVTNTGVVAGTPASGMSTYTTYVIHATADADL